MMKTLSERRFEQRAEIESKLSAVQLVGEFGHKLFSKEGFIELYLDMAELYPTCEQAYEALEMFYKQVFGERRYSEYHSFRVIMNRYIDKCHKETVSHRTVARNYSTTNSSLVSPNEL